MSATRPAPDAGEAKPFTIRDAREDERELTVALTLAAYREYQSGIPDFAWKEYVADMEDILRNDISSERIVAERAGSLVGSVLLMPGPMMGITEEGETVQVNWPEVRLLAVPPHERGQGIGKGLMIECERRARAAGHSRLGLHTSDLMAIARGMYERMGYVREPELDFHPIPGIVISAYSLDLK